MAYKVEVVADSKGPNGIRLVTMEMTYPLIIHNELMTHRVFSRNTASNRAIPVQRMIDSVLGDPFVPERWPRNSKGMQPPTDLDEQDSEAARQFWLLARDQAVERAQALAELGVHKQITNRLLAPWLWTTAVVTATHWANFFNLRCHPDAQAEMHKLADMAQLRYYESTPRQLQEGEWHCPYVKESEGLTGPPWNDLGQDDPQGYTRIGYYLMVSAGRCAGVSYLRQGEGKDAAEAFDLACRIKKPGHWSPFEHQAQARAENHYDWSGNFFGWTQFRKMFIQENRLIFRPSLPETEAREMVVNVS